MGRLSKNVTEHVTSCIYRRFNTFYAFFVNVLHFCERCVSMMADTALQHNAVTLSSQFSDRHTQFYSPADRCNTTLTVPLLFCFTAPPHVSDCKETVSRLLL